MCLRLLIKSNLNIVMTSRAADPAVCCSPGRMDVAPVAAGWYRTCVAATRRALQLGSVLFCVTVGRLLLKNGQLGQADQFPSAGETAARLATSASLGCVVIPLTCLWRRGAGRTACTVSDKNSVCLLAFWKWPCLLEVVEG